MTISVMLMALLFGGMLYLGREHAPLAERLELADPLNRFLPARSVLRPSEEEIAGATLLQEADAARHGNVAEALRLWAPDGVIVDASDASLTGETRHVWQGMDQLKERYVWEFTERRYETLHHLNLTISIHGDEAIILDDLDALVDTHGEKEHLHLPRTDRWLLRRDRNDWKIERLEVNRALRAGLGSTTSERAEQR